MGAIDGVIGETYDCDGVKLESVSTLDDLNRALSRQGRVPPKS